jgi:hypothetical protein
LKTKLENLKKFKNDIKKKRVILDDSRSSFKLDSLEQLMRVKNTSQVKGYPCVGSSEKYIEKYNTRLGVKINPIETKFNKEEHPMNLEHIYLKQLTEDLVDNYITPNIVYFLGYQKVSNKAKALKFIGNDLKVLENEGCITHYSNVLFSEFIEGGCLNKWIKNIYNTEVGMVEENISEDELKSVGKSLVLSKDLSIEISTKSLSIKSDSKQTSISNSKSQNELITLDQWKYLVFSLLYTIDILQTKYKLSHNDFHYGNILIDTSIKPEGYLVYKRNGKTFYFKNYGFIPKLWDFEFAMNYNDAIPKSYPNKFVVGENKIKSDYTFSEDNFFEEFNKEFKKSGLNRSEMDSADSSIRCTPYNYNKYYDVHYFLTSLLDLYIPQSLFDWILQLFPEQLIPDDLESSNSNSSNTSNTSSNTNISNSNISNSNISSNLNNSNSETIETADTIYMAEGRLLNGVEKKFTNLPNANSLLDDSFFDKFTNKPRDLTIENSIIFEFK